MRSTSGSLPTPASTPPPAVASVEHLLRRRGIDDLPGARGHRPALLQVVRRERRPVLAFEDVLGDDVEADVVLVAEHVVEEARGWDLELDQRGVRIDHRRLIQHFLDVLAPLDLGAELVECVQRIGDVLGRKRLAVAPCDAGARLDGEFRVVVVVAVALRQPEDFLVGEGAVERQRLVDDVAAELRVRADDIRAPELMLGVLAIGAAADRHERPVARYILDLAGRNGGRDVEETGRDDARAHEQRARPQELATAGLGPTYPVFHP